MIIGGRYLIAGGRVRIEKKKARPNLKQLQWVVVVGVRLGWIRIEENVAARSKQWYYCHSRVRA